MSTDEIRAIELLSRVSYGRVATSMRAMPFVAPARHVVSDGRVLLRMHRGLGYHRACNGSVVAYGADNCDSGAEHIWSVQFTGTAEIVEPTAEERAAFGPEPVRVDGEPFTPVFMRIDPQFVTVHELDYRGQTKDGPRAESLAENPAGDLAEGPAGSAGREPAEGPGREPAEGPGREPAGNASESPSGPSAGAPARAPGEGPFEARSGAGFGADPEAGSEVGAEIRPEVDPEAGAGPRHETRPEAPPEERHLHHAA